MPSTEPSVTSALSGLDTAVSSRSRLCQEGNRTAVDAPSLQRTGITWCVGATADGRITMSRTCACSVTTTTST